MMVLWLRPAAKPPEQLLVSVLVQAETVAEIPAEVAELRRWLGRNRDKFIDVLAVGRSYSAAGQAPTGAEAPAEGRCRFGACVARRPGRDGAALPAGVGGWADPAGATDLGTIAAHQQQDIPQVTARVVQQNRHRVQCGLRD